MEGEGGGELEGLVGSIVWVRRRNGSWWPGRILGPDEVSASHLMSPRCGTPVKLLGRDDASVDWYNLEKSRRIKAFRCGEFDDCIEKAESSPVFPLRKREKYARREDAILHALELEKQFEMKHTKGNISIGISNKTSARKSELNNYSSEVDMRNDDTGLCNKFVSHKYQTVKKVVPIEGDSTSNPWYSHKMESDKILGWEENIPEAIPRISELQHFGFQVATLKRELSSSVTCEISGNPSDNCADILSPVGHMMEDPLLPLHTDDGQSCVFVRSKRSEDGVVEDSLFEKHDRSPLLQASQTPVTLPIYHSFYDSDTGVIPTDYVINHLATACRARRSACIYLPTSSNDGLDRSVDRSDEMDTIDTQFEMNDQLHQPVSLAEDTSSELIEATESDSSEMVTWENKIEEEGSLFTDKCQIMDKTEMPLSSCISELHLNAQSANVYPEMGIFSWHMKGKRNRRNLAKRPLNRTKWKTFTNAPVRDNGSVKGMAYDGIGNNSTVGRTEPSMQRNSGQGVYLNKVLTHTCDGGDVFDSNLLDTNMTGYGGQKYPSSLQAAKGPGMNYSRFDDSDSGSQLISHSGWEDEVPTHASQRVYSGESDDCIETASAGRIIEEMEPMLVDVNLKVQARYQGEHVPLVSLMSRLNGKAIIGHPIQVEILEDGSCGQAFLRYNAVSAWRTDRTDMQSMLSFSPATTSFKNDQTEVLQYSDRENKPLIKNYSRHFSQQAQMAKKSMSYARQRMSRKSYKKSTKRVNMQSNQKSRMLSSVATDKKRRRENTGRGTTSRENIWGRLINPDALVPSVTCVPVKVVFSRILEAVGRPSAAAVHRVRMTMIAARDPS